MVTIKVRLPRESFEKIMSTMKEGDTTGLSWVDGVLQPTKVTSSSNKFQYSINRPMAVDRFFSLQNADLKGVHMKEGKGAWRRCNGCAALKISDSPKPGTTASVMSMVGANLILHFNEPRRHRAWPTLTLKYWVLTVWTTWATCSGRPTGTRRRGRC